jgi:hypothetical protein
VNQKNKKKFKLEPSIVKMQETKDKEKNFKLERKDRLPSKE